eukprot:SAG31_NODE_124_length_23684_cov_7.200127_3_plen_95_part_00
MDADFVLSELGLQEGMTGLLLNGRWTQGISNQEEPVMLEDLQALADVERATRAKPALDMLTKAKGLKLAWAQLQKDRGQVRFALGSCTYPNRTL